MVCITFRFFFTLCNCFGCFERKQSPNTVKPRIQFALLLTTCPFSAASRARFLSARPFTDSLNMSTYFLLPMSLWVFLGRCVYRELVPTANESSPLWVETAPLSLRAVCLSYSALPPCSTLLPVSLCVLPLGSRRCLRRCLRLTRCSLLRSHYRRCLTPGTHSPTLS
ncbi:hypothetical protein FKM82_006798 [Ascaphus truei]